MPRIQRALQIITGVFFLLCLSFTGLPTSQALAEDNAPTPFVYNQRLPLIYYNYRNIGSLLLNYVTEPLYKNNTQWNMISIQADKAWKMGYGGGNGPIVAVVDTGVDLDNPDLVNNLLPGYNEINPTALPQDDSAMGHGTHIAGIIAAEINGKGVLGVAPFASILPVKVLNKDGIGTTKTVGDGIRWAADHRANIINLSLGYRLQNNFNDTLLSSAIEYAQSKGCLVIAAVGNYHTSTLNYPAGYLNVLAVSAVDREMHLASFSSYGDYKYMLTAPGVNITSTYLGGSYQTGSGTSQAAAHVSGAAAIIKDAHPTYSSAQIMDVLLKGALSLGNPSYYGAGLVQVDKAVSLSPASSSALAKDTLILETGLPGEDRSAAIEPGIVLVRFDKAQDPSKLIPASLPGLKVTGSITSLDVVEMSVPVGQEWAMVDALRAVPGVSLAEPNYILQMY